MLILGFHILVEILFAAETKPSNWPIVRSKIGGKMVNKQITERIRNIKLEMDKLAMEIQKDVDATPYYSSRPACLRVIKKLEVVQEVLSL